MKAAAEDGTMPDTIELEARLENLPRMLEFVTACARRCGLAARSVHNLELAAEEALVNVCSYAYPAGQGKVRLECCCRDSGGLVLKISDKGKAFNPLEADRPDLESRVSRRQVGGLGIFMLRNLVEQVGYTRRGGRNVLTLEMGGEGEDPHGA